MPLTLEDLDALGPSPSPQPQRRYTMEDLDALGPSLAATVKAQERTGTPSGPIVAPQAGPGPSGTAIATPPGIESATATPPRPQPAVAEQAKPVTRALPAPTPSPTPSTALPPPLASVSGIHIPEPGEVSLARERAPEPSFQAAGRRPIEPRSVTQMGPLERTLHGVAPRIVDAVNNTVESLKAGAFDQSATGLFGRFLLKQMGQEGPATGAPATTYEQAVALLGSLASDWGILKVGSTIGAAGGKAMLAKLGEKWYQLGRAIGLTEPQARAAVQEAVSGSLTARAIMGVSSVAGAVGLQSGAAETGRQMVEGSGMVPGKIVTEAAKGAALGAGAGLVGAPISNEALHALATTAYWSVVAPLVHEGRLPTPSDLLAVGVPMLVIEAVTRAGRLARPSVDILPPGTPLRAQQVAGRRVEPEQPAEPVPPTPPTKPPVTPTAAPETIPTVGVGEPVDRLTEAERAFQEGKQKAAEAAAKIATASAAKPHENVPPIQVPGRPVVPQGVEAEKPLPAPSVAPTEAVDRAKLVVEAAGAKWNGVWEGSGNFPAQATFTEPTTGSTTVLPLDQVTPESVAAKLAEVRARFAPGTTERPAAAPEATKPAVPAKVTPQVPSPETGYVLPGFVGKSHAGLEPPAPELPKRVTMEDLEALGPSNPVVPLDLEKLGPAMRAAEIRSRTPGMVVTFRGETWTFDSAPGKDFWRSGKDVLGTGQLVSHIRDLGEKPAAAAPAPAPAATTAPAAPAPAQLPLGLAARQPEEPTSRAQSEQFSVSLGQERYPVASLKEASEKFRAVVDTAGTGSSQTPVPLVLDKAGKVVGHIAYNGRVWPGLPADWKSGMTPLYDPRLEGKPHVAQPEEKPALGQAARPPTEAPRPTEDTSRMEPGGHYAVEVIADASGKWAGNGARFRTPEKAEEYARDLHGRWTAVRDWRVVDLAAAGPATVSSMNAPLPEPKPEEKPAEQPSRLSISYGGTKIASVPGPKEFGTQGPEKVEQTTKPAPIPAEYEHKERFGKLVSTFEKNLTSMGKLFPTDVRDLRKMAGEATGLTHKTFGEDPEAVDDLHDALETAVNTIYRRGSKPDATLAERMERALRAEGFLGNRTRTLGLSDRQQFSTPLPLAEAAAWAADVRPGEMVLEPTAGTGNLLAPLPRDTAVLANEIDPRRLHALVLQGWGGATAHDYLKEPIPAQVAVMNPPWGKYTTQKYGKAIPMPYGDPIDFSERFVVKALRELQPGGRLVAIMPTTILQAPAFLGWLNREHTLRAVIQSPPGAYDTRGTTVESVLLVVDKGRVANATPTIRETPADWAAYTRAVEPLGSGGEGPGQAARTGPAAALGSVAPAPRPAPRAPGPPAAAAGGGGAVRPGGGERVSGEGALAGPAGGVAPPGEPGRKPEAPVRGLPVHAQAGAARPDAGLVALGGRGGKSQPKGEGGGLPAEPIRHARPVEQRFSYVDQSEFDAASRSPVFAPAPLRSAAGANPHPRLIVKTRSLLGARLPELTYTPKGKLLPEAYRNKTISDQQWDYGIIPALQVPGFLAASDVGVGKTRMAAAVAGEWLETDKKRVLYLTASEVNIQDVKREFDIYAGGKGKWPFQILEIKGFKDAKEGSRGEYSPLPVVDKAIYIIDRYNLTAYRRAIMELDFDAIIGDEAHLVKNIEGSAVGKSWLMIQKQTLNRNGHFLYMTATPAVDFDDLEHLIGLREWHPDGFIDYKNRVTGNSPPLTSEGQKAEQAALEGRLQDLMPPDEWDQWRHTNIQDPKPFMTSSTRMDLLSQNIAALQGEIQRRQPIDTAPSHMGVTKKSGKSRFGGSGDPFGMHITPAEQEQIMRELAMKGKYDSVDLWRAGVEFEIAVNPPNAEQVAEYDKLSDFFHRLDAAFYKWGRLNKSNKRMLTIRHFLQFEAKSRMFDYRIDHAIGVAKAALARGEQPILSTIRVNEGSPEEGNIPAAINTINTRDVEVGDNGEIISDDEIPEALVVRAEFMDEWSTMRQTRNPVELIQQAFGKENVAVITGDVSAKQREKLIKEFQDGKRKVALISGAGKTGISLHHVTDTGSGEKGRRHLIIMDYEWSATQFKQELGRSDRSGQLTSPKVTPMSTGGAGERKFLATIANRMRNLGALSKGSAESASNDKLAEFEIGGSLDTHAMRMAYRGLRADLQEQFMARVWRDPNSFDHETGTYRNTRSYPQSASLKDFLLDLQFMPLADADKAFEAFWAERERLIKEQQENAEDRAGKAAVRTRTNTGEIVRSIQLNPMLELHQVKDSAGHSYGILQGVVTDYMPIISRFLPTNTLGNKSRQYVTFRAGTTQVAGLEIRPGAIRGLADEFGHSLAGMLDTPEKVLDALRAGDRVPLHGEGGFILRMRQDKKIAIEGAKMAQRAELLNHGASYQPSGNVWILPDDKLAGFLSRYPVKMKEPGAPKTPDQVTQENLGKVREQRAEEGQAGRASVGTLAGPFGRMLGGQGGEPPEHVQSPDEDVERALTATAARGILPTLNEQLLKAYQQVRNGFIYENVLVDFPIERDKVRVFMGARREAFVKSGEDVAGVVGQLQNDEERHIFQRMIELRDWRWTLEDPERHPGGVPEGLTLEQVDSEMERLTPMVSTRVREAVRAHDDLVAAEASDLEQRELMDPERRNPYYYPHKVLPKQPEGGANIGAGRRMQAPNRGFTKARHGSSLPIESDYISTMYQHRAEVRFANAVDDFAQSILEEHDRRGDLEPEQRHALAPGQEFILDGQEYRATQYKPGRGIFGAITVPERILEQALANGEEMIPVAELTRAGALGRYHRIYVVPKAIAGRFESWAPEKMGDIMSLLTKTTTQWKRGTIGFWGMSGNWLIFLGDLLNLSRSPMAYTKIPQAIKDVWDFQHGSGKDFLEKAKAYDLPFSTWIENEATWRQRMPELRQFMSRGQILRAEMGNILSGIGLGAAHGYVVSGFNPVGAAAGAALGGYAGGTFFTRTIPQFRDLVPRLAMARYQVGRLESGKGLKPAGTSIEGLEGTERGAFKIAREFTADFPKFTPEENRLFRGMLLPFYGFMRHNTPNWWRYLTTASISMFTLLGMRLLTEVWNNLFPEFREIEQSLEPWKRGNWHIITPFQGADGKLIVVHIPGDPMAHALRMAGQGNTINRVSDLMNEHITWNKAIHDQLWDLTQPLSEVTNLLNPIVKMPIEILANRSVLTHKEIVPPALKGTPEEWWRKLDYVFDSLVRPFREAENLVGTPEQQQDPLTHRFGLGLPLWREDQQRATEKNATVAWRDARDEYKSAVLSTLHDLPFYTQANPKQREALDLEWAKKAEHDFDTWIRPPVSGRQRALEHWQDISPKPKPSGPQSEAAPTIHGAGFGGSRKLGQAGRWDPDEAAQKAADKTGLNASFIRAVMQAENEGKPVGTSPKGAVGPMQLMPGTAKDVGVLDPKDPWANTIGGAMHLAHLMNHYDGDQRKAVAGYNWGEGHLDVVLDVYPDTWEAHVPKETQEHLRKVFGVTH